MAAQDPTVSTESNGSALVVTSIVMLTLTWFSVILRGWVRSVLVKSFQSDDWMLLVAQINFTISCGFILRGCYWGLGRHNLSLSQPDEIKALEYQALATATYVSNMLFIKLSIAIFLLRIAVQRRYQYIIYVSMAVVFVWSLALFFWDVFQCTPVEAQWDYTLLQRNPDAKCASADAVVMAAYALSVMNILSDWLYALLPIPMIWRVKMTIEAKLTVSLVLGLGIFASIATLVRIRFLADLMETSDILHNGTDAMVWTLIEPGVAIIASSLATIRPLLRAMGIRGFQFTEHSGRPRGISGTHPKTNQSNGQRGMSCLGTADATVSDIELAHTKGRMSRSASDATKRTSRGLPPGFAARMAPVAEGGRAGGGGGVLMKEGVEGDGSSSHAGTEISASAKSFETGYQRVEIRRANETVPTTVYLNPAMSQPLPSPAGGSTAPHHTWLNSSVEQLSSRDSSVDFVALQPEHSQNDIRTELGSPYRR